MRRTLSLSMLAGAAFGVSGAAAIAESGAPTGASQDEVRAMVAEMLADAESRSSLLQGGGTAGHDGKFFLASPDGNFRMNISGQVQFRYTANFAEDGSFVDRNEDGVIDDGDEEDEFDSGFENRRTRLVFDGTLYDNMFYKLQGDFGRDGGDFELLDGYFGWDLGDGMKITVGQFKAPLLREELVSSKYQLAADRSFVNEFFTANRTQGIMFSNEMENLRYAFSVNDGAESGTLQQFGDGAFIGEAQNTGFEQDGSDIAFTGRVEYLVSGEWGAFKDFTSEAGSAVSSMFGVAGHWQLGADRPGALGDDSDDVFVYTADFSVEGDGWNAFIAGMGSNTDSNAPGGSSSDNFGYLVQGGVNVTEDTEVFGRFEQLHADGDGVFSEENRATFVTVGVNHYLHGHAAKFTLDVNYSFDEGIAFGADPVNGIPENTSTLSAPGIGFLGSGDEDELFVRAQFQLLF